MGAAEVVGDEKGEGEHRDLGDRDGSAEGKVVITVGHGKFSRCGFEMVNLQCFQRRTLVIQRGEW